jgi:prolyl-tRNA editing enzyme YbaK/EbsC (Cys-tRNA(Pro) deacylase)
MPRFKIETSLFEPVTIEVEGGRTYESVELSPGLLEAVDEIDKKKIAGTLDGLTASVQQIALIFGLEPEVVKTVDFRILNLILEHVAAVMMSSRAVKVAEVGAIKVPLAAVGVVAPVPEKPPVDEVTAEKNAPKPEVTQLP